MVPLSTYAILAQNLQNITARNELNNGVNTITLET